MRLRMLCSMAAERWSLMEGQVLTVQALTPEMVAWLTPGPDGRRRAELLRDDETPEAAILPPASEMAVLPPVKRKRGRPRRVAQI
jgi:hypothetical protein